MDDIRKCAECKHFVGKSHKDLDGYDFTIWGCELWDCDFKERDESEGDNDT